MLFRISNALGDAVGAIITFLPLALAFILVLLVGWMVAKALRSLTDRALTSIGFNKWVERGGVGRAMQRTKYDAADIPAMIVYWAVWIFTLQLAFGLFGPNPISSILNDIIGYLPAVFAATLIVVIGTAIATAVREMAIASVGGLSYGKALATAAGGAILFVTIFAALNQLGIAPLIVTGLFYAALAVVVGIAIVAVGGGGIQPMRQYWQRMLDRAEEEAPKLKEETRGATERIKERAEERQEEFAMQGSGNGHRGERRLHARG